MKIVQLTPTPDDDTVAAILAALASMATEVPGDAPDAAPARSAWATASRLVAQGLPPTRRAAAGWASAERARRAERWSSGIVGV